MNISSIANSILTFEGKDIMYFYSQFQVLAEIFSRFLSQDQEENIDYERNMFKRFCIGK